MGNICWFTNLDIKKRHELLETGKKYNPEYYKTYDNYNAIEVSKTADIPMDYDGIMGVPVTFMALYNPDQFEIIEMTRRGEMDKSIKTKIYTINDYPKWNDLNAGPTIIEDGKIKCLYHRILIRRK